METFNNHIIQSPDINAERLESLRKLYPDWFTQEGKLDIDEIKKAVNPEGIDETERYEFRWFGKSKAKRNAFMPTRATLHYDTERSVNPDNTDNIIIEGENLEVLKILLNGYRNKVKVIYIDPPYNTGNDFVYCDDFTEDKHFYWEKIEQRENGITLDTNLDSDGHYHSNWLDMMFSRLLVARNLLREDGVMFISIDDHEVHHLRKLCDEVFGEKNFIANLTIIVKPEGRGYGPFAKTHESLLVYAKDKDLANFNEVEVEGAKYQYSDENGGFNLKGLRNRNVQAFNSLNRPNLRYPFYVDINNPNQDGLCKVSVFAQEGYVEVWPSTINGIQSVWRWGKEKANTERDNLVAYRGNDNEIRIFQKERKLTQTPKTVWIDRSIISNKGTAEIQQLLGNGVFDFPKPVELIRRIIDIASDSEDIILDFFAGSGTTGDALITQNLKDLGCRKFILVQVPQAMEVDSKARRAGFKKISDITIARNKAVIEKIKESYNGRILTPEDEEQLNQLGFKVFTLTKSSFPRTDFAPDPDKSDEENLALFRQYVATKEQQLSINFNEQDLITEILISRGFMLTYKIVEQTSLTENTVYLASDGIKEAYICVDNQLYDSTVNYFMEHPDTKFICIERALDSTMKFNLKSRMKDKFLAF